MSVQTTNRCGVLEAAARHKGLPAFLAFAMIVAMAVFPAWNKASAATTPAMKAGVAASDTWVMQSQLVDGSSSQTVDLLTLTLHTTNPEDVEFSVTAECAVAWSSMISIGSVDTKAAVKVWVEVDGVAVPVSPSAGDDGKVTFCSRDTQLDASIPGGFFSLYEKTKAANAFNWVLANAGVGTHTVVVKGRLDAYVTDMSGTGSAKAGVGRRTLTAEPVHLTNDATF
jgi:hypothetical protein